MSGASNTFGIPTRLMATSVFEAETLPHRAVLFQSAYSLLRDRAEAEDAVQETYLQAWKSFDAFEPGTNCRAWLFSILVNKIRHHRRKWTFRMRLTNDPNVFDRTISSSAEAIRDEVTDPEILAALRKLPPNFAQALLLADLYEFSYKEISETMGCPVGTVMSRMNRARESLRTSLAKLAKERGTIRSKLLPQPAVELVFTAEAPSTPVNR